MNQQSNASLPDTYVNAPLKNKISKTQQKLQTPDNFVTSNNPQYFSSNRPKPTLNSQFDQDVISGIIVIPVSRLLTTNITPQHNQKCKCHQKQNTKHNGISSYHMHVILMCQDSNHLGLFLTLLLDVI